MNFLRKLFGLPNAPEKPSLQEIDAETVRAWQKNGDCLLIDVREDREYKVERIKGARLAPLSRLEQAVPPSSDGLKAVFLCQSGMRTRTHAGRLQRCGFSEAYILRGGMSAWKAAGLPVERE